MKKALIYIFIALFILTASYTVMTPHPAEAACGILGWKLLDCVAQGVSFIIVPILGAIVRLAGEILNYSITWTLNLSDFVAKVPAIGLAWKTIRDFATMTFIFLILYQAISMILGLEGLGKKFIVNVVIAGLLINFSLFFTNVIIDASNIVTMQFYNGITSTGDISGVFMQQLNMQSMLDKTAAASKAVGNQDNGGNSLTVLVMGSILMLVAAFTFFAAALLFLVRSATLILLMALSPFAYIGNVLPNTGQGAASLSKKWWPTLLSQCTFAPVFLLLVYIGMKILASPGFTSAIHNANGKDSLVAIIFNFVIVIMFFLFALIVGKESGTWGAGKIVGWGDSLRKWGQGAVTGGIGRNTFGLAARSIADSQAFKNIAARNPSLGTFATAGLSKVSGASYGGKKGGYDKVRKDKEKAQVELGKKLFDDGAEEKAKEAHLSSAEKEKTKNLAYAENIDRNADAVTDKVRQDAMRKAANDARKAANEAYEKAKKQADQAGKEAGKARQEKYLSNLSRPNIIMGNKGGVYAPWNRATRKSAAKALRKEMKKGPKEKLLEDLLKDTKAEDESKEEKPKKEEK